MKPLKFLFVAIAAIFFYTQASAQQPRPGYSVFATSNSQALQSIQIDDRLYVDDELPISGKSAALEIRSESRGALLPRMTTTQRNDIASPATGLTIYNTTTSSYNYYDGSAWQSLTGSSSNYWANTGNYVYPATLSDSVGIGTNSPIATLDVQGSFNLSNNDNMQVQLDTNLFDLAGFFGSQFYIKGFGARRFVKPDSTAWIFSKVSDDSNLEGSEVAAIGYVNGVTFDEVFLEADSSEVYAFAGNESFGTGLINSRIDSVIKLVHGAITDEQTTAISLSHDGALKLYSPTIYDNFELIDGTEALNRILTSDADGAASWKIPQSSTLYSDVTAATTTGTDWQELASYTLPANTLDSDGNSIELILAHVGSVTGDSLKLTLGTTEIFIDNNSGVNNDLLTTEIARLTANSQLSITGSDFIEATEDLTTELDLKFLAKSVTSGNQTLKYFKVKRSK